MMISRENRRTAKKNTYSSATLPTTNVTWIHSGLNMVPQGEKPASSRLSQVSQVGHSIALILFTIGLFQ